MNSKPIESTLEATASKPGIKTSEFWLTILFTVLVQAGPLATQLNGNLGVIANAVVVAAYAVSRAKAKSLGVAIPLLLCGLFCFGLPSCTQVVPSYTVDGEGIEWGENPVQTLPASRVTPNVRVPLPEQLGGGEVVVPIVINPSK